jgi:cytochrome c oxidase assembly protein subunit 15
MDFRRLVVATTVATAVTALLGVLTATSGAGLTCEARWPLCDGAVFGLFPATFMSAIEWFHRLVAMITGVLIVGTTVAAWRGGRPRRVGLATLGALVLTPIQVAFGAFTVLVREFVFGYSIVVLTLHFALAAAILGLLIAASIWTDAAETPITTSRLRDAGAAALLALPVLLVLTPRLLVTFGEVVQLVYYAAGFGAFAALTAVALWALELDAPAVAVAAGLSAALVIAQLVFARRAFGDAGQLAILGLTVAAFALACFAVRRSRTVRTPVGDVEPTGD